MTYTGNNGTLNTDYNSSAWARQATPGTGAFRGGNTWANAHGDIDASFESTTSYRQGSSAGTYRARTGDTLAGIAQAIWGDSSLWYKLAEANGLSADAALMDGQQLTLPSGVTRSKNNAATFKPYDPSETIGDTSPTNPAQPKPPKKKGCGGLGAVLLVAVAVAVTIVTSGAALAALSPAVTSVGSGIATVLGTSAAVSGVGGAGLIAAGAIGGAVGSMVSQGLGVATGLQDKFSWKGVALAGLAGGIGAGLGPNGAFGQAGAFGRIGSPALSAGLRGAASSALTQGIAVATRLQDKFDWTAVAAAGVGSAAASTLSGVKGFGSLGKFGGRLTISMASGIVNAASRSIAEGSSFGDNLLATLPDVIGNTIGNMIAVGVAGDPNFPRSVAKRADRQFEPYLSKDELKSPEFQAARKVAKAEFEAQVEAARASNDPRLMRLARDQYADFYASASPGFAAELSYARTLSVAPDLSRDAAFMGLADGEIVVTARRAQRGVAIMPAVDPLSVEAGNIAINVGSAAQAAIDRVPGGRLAVTLLDVGLAIGGGPVRYAIGQAYEAGKDKLIAYATEQFVDARFGRDARAGGIGLHKRALPVACDSSGGIFCIDLEEDKGFPIVYFENGGAWQDEPYEPLYAAPSFDAFLAQIHD